MLILTRKLNESICIGNNITVKIVEIDGGKIRIGITAPAEVSVDRMEVRQSKERSAAHAATAKAIGS